MPAPFASLTVREAQQRLEEADSAQAQRARLYASGDHWQGGRGWRGPRPQAGEEGEADVMHEIAGAFVSKNAIGEVLRRHIAGVIGRPVTWKVVTSRPNASSERTADEEARIAEAEAALTTWWDSQEVATLLQTAVGTLLSGGRVPLRLFVPPGLLEDSPTGPRLPPGDVPAQLERIAPDLPLPAAARVISDAATRMRAGLFVYEEDRQPYVEISAVEGRDTVLRILGAAGGVSETRLPLDGRLLMHEMQRPALITPQIMSLQDLLNLTLTMLSRNMVLGGFLERVLLNTMLPGTYTTDPATGLRVFVPRPLSFGGGTVNALMGAEIRDETTGELKGYAKPDIVYKDPVPVETFASTRDIAYRAILEECQQAHALISGEGAPSGESRRQALADFLSSLRLTAPVVEHAVRWLLETALHMAAHFAGQPGRYLDLRVVATCNLDTGPLSADDVQQIIAMVEAEIWSREEGMARSGVDDTDAMAQRIAVEREQRATVGQTVIESFNSGM